MAESFPLVEIPEALVPVVGKQDNGNRKYRAQGSAEEFVVWMDALTQHFGKELIPMAWAPDYVGVSRMGVYKRAKEGGLTAFIFNLTDDVKLFFGKPRKCLREQYVYLVLSECRAWAKELEARRQRRMGYRPEDFDDDD